MRRLKPASGLEKPIEEEEDPIYSHNRQQDVDLVKLLV
jgi:hypothetical protein